MLEKSTTPETDNESEFFHQQLRSMGKLALPEYIRIAADTTYSDDIRTLAILFIHSEPSAVPMLIKLLDEPNDTVTSMTTHMLDGCINLGAFSIGDTDQTEIINNYKEWWAKHRLNYRQELARLYYDRKPLSTAHIDFSKDTVKDVRNLLIKALKGQMFRTNSNEVQRVLHLGKPAIPEAIKVAADTGIPGHFLIYSMLGYFKDTDVTIPFLMKTVETSNNEHARGLSIQSLNQILNLGMYHQGDPNKYKVINRYHKWWARNKRSFLQLSNSEDVNL